MLIPRNLLQTLLTIMRYILLILKKRADEIFFSRLSWGYLRTSSIVAVCLLKLLLVTVLFVHLHGIMVTRLA